MEFIFSKRIKVNIPVEAVLYLGDQTFSATSYEPWEDEGEDYLDAEWGRTTISQKVRLNNKDFLFKMIFTCTANSDATLFVHNAELIDSDDKVIHLEEDQLEEILRDLDLYIKINYKSESVNDETYGLNGKHNSIEIIY